MTVMMASGQRLLHKASGGVLGGYPNPGMSMRFSVEVEGLETPGRHLGLWHSCKGLQVDLKYEKLAEGGVNLVTERLPDKIEYSEVTLERAVEKKSSHQVKEWLEGYIKTWNTYQSVPHSKGPQNPSVIITLLDYQLDEVMSWTLQNAYPIKWTGPSLSATENTVATETLVIEHTGFFSFHPGLRKARLIQPTGAGATSVEFQFNPENITLEHATELEESPGSKLTKSIRSISMPDLKFDGPDTLARCEQLLEWSSPQKAGVNEEYYLTPLVFQWGLTVGGSRRIKVTLPKAKIEYLRFDAMGNPVRATAQLTLRREDLDALDQQNPTSGGLSDRKGHAMINGETLAGVALGTYGNPGRWRAVAAANQIDDPLRVRPGSVLLLPNRAELAEGGAA